MCMCAKMKLDTHVLLAWLHLEMTLIDDAKKITWDFVIDTFFAAIKHLLLHSPSIIKRTSTHQWAFFELTVLVAKPAVQVHIFR